MRLRSLVSAHGTAELDAEGEASQGAAPALWWRVRRISPSKFESLADTGDVLLFRSSGTFPRLIRAASGGGRYDHVALLLRVNTDMLALLEATGNEGVGMCMWEDFLRHGWQKLYPEVAMRRVRFPRSPERLEALEAWTNEVIGKPYGLTVAKLMKRSSNSGSFQGGDADFFCSQLVAEALKVLGVIPRGKSSTQFWPSTFSAKKAPLETMPGTWLDSEDLVIDFSIVAPGIVGDSPDDGAHRRDETVRWG